MRNAYLFNRPINVNEITDLVDISYEPTTNWKVKSNKLQPKSWRESTRYKYKPWSSRRHHGHSSRPTSFA